MRSVLITRPQPVASLLAKKLEEGGFSPYLSPMMEYVPLEGALDDLNTFQAVIFTSAQAVISFTERTDDRRLIALAVGDATAAAATRAGFSKVFSAKGDSGDMVRLIRDKAPTLGLARILHICSDDTPNYIGDTIANLGVDVVRRPLYKAQLLDTFTDETARALRQGGIDAVVFFSARAAERFVSLVKKEGLESHNLNLTAVCISPRVAAHIKGVPWLTLRVASHPSLESVLDVLRMKTVATPVAAPMPTDSVILAFNGILPLSQALNLPTDAIKSWTDAGIVPAEKVEDVLRACRAQGIEPVRLWGASAMAPTRRATEGPHPTAERRGQGNDRRQKSANLDANRLVNEPTYRGVDRRAGADRRTHARRQQAMVKREKMKIFDRTVLTFVIMFIIVVGLGMFLMAPEYFSFQEKRIDHAQAPAKPATADRASRAGAVTLQNAVDLGRTPEGRAALANIYQTLRAAAIASAGDTQTLAKILQDAKAKDPMISSLFGNISGRDLAAAGLLLILHEFRANVNASRPYAQDLAVLQSFVGNDPKMALSIQKLAPYAESGARSHAELQTELQALASDIVLAKLAGQDVSAQQMALERWRKLSAANSPQQVQGLDEEAVVARAQILMSQGNTQGAMHELQSLKGRSAAVAQGWMNDAARYVMATQASNTLMQNVIQTASTHSPPLLEKAVAFVKRLLNFNNAVYISPALQQGGSHKGVLAP